MFHFSGQAKMADMTRIKEVPLYTAETQSLVIMKIQFRGGPEAKCKILLANNGYKEYFKARKKIWVEAEGGDESVSLSNNYLNSF